MLTFVHCLDGPDAFRLRVAEFEGHGKHISGVRDRMCFGAPLATKDVDVVSGDPSLVSSLLVYEESDLEAGAALALEDPYFKCGAWRRLEFYTAPGLSGLQNPSATSARHYLALLRRDVGAGFDQAALDRIGQRLGSRAVLRTLLECEGVACNGDDRVWALRALMVFCASDLEQAQADFAAALDAPSRPGDWTIQRISRVSGMWFGVSPDALVREQLARGA
jgi:uncharacterized protein YciI